MVEVMFVCTANICRSPMAAALWSAAGGTAASAGVRGFAGQPMHPLAHAELTRRGLGVAASAFTSRQATPPMLKSAGVILCMEAAHRAELAKWVPAAASKTFVVSEFAALTRTHPGQSPKALHRLRRTIDPQPDIADPVNGGALDFENCADVLDGYLRDIRSRPGQ